MENKSVSHQKARRSRTPTPGRAPSAPTAVNFPISRKAALGVLLLTALLAFEIFNLDTTRYALQNLLGDVSFIGIPWAMLLAIAFCAIDFAGLARLFTPEENDETPKAVWYLMGAWLLGATMNAIMTWWAVSLTLLSHEFGNEVLSREQLLQAVPIFVATLVWLTRILFIGAITMAGEHMFDLADKSKGHGRSPVAASPSDLPRRAPVREKPAPDRPAVPPAPNQPPLSGGIRRVPGGMAARSSRR